MVGRIVKATVGGAPQVIDLIRAPTPVATYHYGPVNSAQLSAGAGTRTYRMEHTALTGATGVRLRYLNRAAVAIQIAAQVETTLLGTQVAVTWGGASTVTIQPHAVAESDPVPGLTLTAGGQFATRTRVTASGQWVLGERNYGGAGRGGAVDGDALTGSIPSSSEYLFGPVAILSATPAPPVKTVGLVTDSFGFGWPVNAFEGTYPTAYVSQNGESAFTWLGTAGRSSEVLDSLGGVRTIVEGYGTNDRASGRTAFQIQTNRVAIWQALRARWPMTRVIAYTIAPRTTSTDSWATTTNQTPIAGEPHRVAVNAWLRDGAPLLAGAVAATGTTNPAAIRAGAAGHPVYAVFELADVVESARDSGVWAVGATTDGIHPGTSGRAAIAAAFPYGSLQ